MTSPAAVGAVRRSVTVALTPSEAFDLFTAGIARWWPADSHAIGTKPAMVILERRDGGRWFERGPDGSECDWGRVLAWEPPGRVLLAWHLDGDWAYDPDPGRASEVEVRFSAANGGTRVDLEHRGFERQARGGEIAAAVGGENGWSGILDGYTTTAASAAR